MSRKELLLKLIRMREPINKQFLRELESYGWDSEELVILKRSDIINVISSYLNNHIGEIDIENWANYLENREDIGFEKTYDITIKDILYELANPDLTIKLSKNR